MANEIATKETDFGRHVVDAVIMAETYRLTKNLSSCKM